MSEFIYINGGIKRPGVLDDETAKLGNIKADGKTIIGLEMTVKEYFPYLDKNIDPQHTEQNSATSCVQDLAENITLQLGKFKQGKGGNVVFTTNRMDLDSVSAYIIADMYLRGEKVDVAKMMPQIMKITEHDQFSKDRTWHRKELKDAFNPNDELKDCKALASLVRLPHITPSKEVMDTIKHFLETGEVKREVVEAFEKTQAGILAITTEANSMSEAKILANKKIEEAKAKGVPPHFSIVYDAGGVSVVISTEKAATDIGYTKNPVVLAVNPMMPNNDGSTYRKLTVCQHGNGYADMDAILAEMQKVEPGCGGQPNIKGSPMNTDSKLDLDTMLDVVKKSLTAEYNRQWIARKTNTGNTNNGKGLEK